MRGSSINSFASTRAFREGSVGLLLLLGLGVFGIVILWLNRLTAAGNSYKAIVEFKNAGGMQKGAVVRYRGVKVGNIAEVRPGPNDVEVVIEINNPNLVIPKDSRVEANQSGLISESIIDITPNKSLPANKKFGKPSEENCNKKFIVCNGSRLRGEIGISIDELIRSSSRLTTLYSQPGVYANVNDALKNTSKAAEELTLLSKNVSKLVRTSEKDLNVLSSAASSVATASKQVTSSTNEAIEQFGSTANEISSVAKEFRTTAKDISLTTKQVNNLLSNVDNLVANNRSSLVTVLDNITETSTQLRSTVDSLSPAINRLTEGELLKNLESLSANASQASANLRDVTKTLNEPNNLLVLQQTLDSARVTFENTQKITSDLDELAGDPAFRQNLKELVGGLSGLVSSTQMIEQQVQVATQLESVKTALRHSQTAVPSTSVKQQNQELSPPSKISAKTTNPQISSKYPTSKEKVSQQGSSSSPLSSSKLENSKLKNSKLKNSKPENSKIQLEKLKQRLKKYRETNVTD